MTKNQHRRLVINYRNKGMFKSRAVSYISMSNNIIRSILFDAKYSLVIDDKIYINYIIEGEHLSYYSNMK